MSSGSSLRSTATAISLSAGDGSVTAFGDARFHGSLAGKKVGPVVGMALDPAGGYWLVTAAGQVFSFGGAVGHGSLSGKTPSSTIVSMASTPAGNGYWLVAADGHVYNFGAAKNLGNAPSATAIAL